MAKSAGIGKVLVQEGKPTPASRNKWLPCVEFLSVPGTSSVSSLDLTTPKIEELLFLEMRKQKPGKVEET